jgi:hypothetical protein
VGEIAGGPVIGHLHITPGLVRIEEDEQIRCAVALVFAIVPLGLARRGRDRQTGLADQLGRAFVEANTVSMPDSLRAAPGRGSSLGASSRLPSTKRRLAR